LILVHVGTTGLVLRFVTRIILSHGVQEKTERVVTCTNPDCDEGVLTRIPNALAIPVIAPF
jgi:hypothetical protein